MLAHVGERPQRLDGFSSWASTQGYPDAAPQRATRDLLELYAESFLSLPSASREPPAHHRSIQWWLLPRPQSLVNCAWIYATIFACYTLALDEPLSHLLCRRFAI